MSEDEKLRLDVFLFRTRFFKSRGLASDAITSKGLRLTRNDQVRRIDKPSTTTVPDDILSFTRGKAIITLRVVSLPERRGPASEAAASYELLNDPL